MKSVRVLLGVLLLLGMTSLPIYGQTQQGDILGTIRDSQGSVVPGAQVKIINEDTGAVRQLTSDDRGDYHGIGFFTASYRVEVEKEGFQKAVVAGVVVQPITMKRVDVTLQVGAVRAEVTVTGAAPVVQTEGPTINATVPKILYDKPMSDISRSGWAFDSAMWLPGSSGAELGLFLWGGVSGNQVELEMEGGQGVIQFFVPPTAVREINVITGSPPAEYGRATTANLTFNSGTNTPHGEYTLYYTSPAINSVNNPWGQPKRSRGLPIFRHTWSVGGPLVIPKVYDGRNKTFVFYSAHRPRTQVQSLNLNKTFPPVRMLSGDLSRYPIKIYDPTTNTQFPGNIIPTNRISSVAQSFIKDWAPFYAGRYVGDPETNFRNNVVVPYDGTGTTFRWMIKVDQNIGSKDVLSYSYHDGNSDYIFSFVGTLNSYVPTYGGGQQFDKNTSLGWTHTFTNRLVSQMRLTMNRYRSEQFSGLGANVTQAGPTLGKVFLDRLGIQGITPVSLSGMPALIVEDWGVRLGNYLGSLTRDTRYQATETLTYTRGLHTVKGGVLFLKAQIDNTYNPGFGSFSFDGGMTAEIDPVTKKRTPGTGDPWADFLLGLPRSFSRGLSRPSIAGRIWEHAGFFQDDWRVTPNLTLSYGLRYDRYGPPYDKNRMFYNFDLASGKIVVPSQFALDHISPVFNTNLIPVVLASSLGYPEKLINPNQRFLPRFGFAYRPTGKGTLVVRGGYGIYDGIFRFAALQTTGPFTGTESYTNDVVVGQGPLYSFPNAFPATIGKSPTASTGNSTAKDYRTDYMQTWNISVEKELLTDWGVRFSYMGNRDTQFPIRYNANTPLLNTLPFDQSRRPYPAFQSVSRIENGGNDRYHALQFLFHHPWRKGLYLQASYMRQWTDNDFGRPGGGYGGPREVAPANTVDYAWNRARDKARVRDWPTHDILVNWAYELPFGTGKHWGANWRQQYGVGGALLNGIAGGWSTTGVMTWHSGLFFTPTYSGVDPGNINQFSGRADVVPGCQVYTKPKTLGQETQWFNPACFTIPANGTLGNARINSLEGPGMWSVQLNPFKEFKLPRWGKWEGATLQVKANIFNFFNHPNYSLPESNIRSPLAGQLRHAAYVREGTEYCFARCMVLAARLYF